MSNLVIIGARAMGRETFVYARDCGMVVKGFLDSKLDALAGFGGYAQILSSVEDYRPAVDDVFVCALGEPVTKRKYVEIIESRGGKFISIVHPTAYIGMNVQMGAGCVICPHTTITCDTKIGSHVILNVNASVNHDAVIGDFVTICPGGNLAGRVKIGNLTFIGAGASVIPDISLGDGVFVAAGAVVTQSFSSGRLMGVPAVQK